MPMVRKQVYIEPRQDRELKRLARQTGKTEAEIIRQALENHVEEARREKQRLEAWRAERAFIEQWVAQGPVPGPAKRWRREDLYDRKCLR